MNQDEGQIEKVQGWCGPETTHSEAATATGLHGTGRSGTGTWNERGCVERAAWRAL